MPEGSILNLNGVGTIKAIGGNAGDGGSAISGNAGGAGGGGAGAGIGGNGGKGGDSNSVSSLTGLITGNAKVIGQSGSDGEKGENCGTVNINNSLTVYAYGGAGASGGIYTTATGSSGTGGGGYPAAGIGGGGAGAGGADHMNGGGGYSSGVAEACSNNSVVVNGGEMVEPEKYATQGSGGSYFYKHRYDGTISTSSAGEIGGQGGNTDYYNYPLDSAGDGGVAGNGGIIKVSNMAKIYAFNGNRYTDGTPYNDGENQLNIFCQSGILRNVYKLNCWWEVKEDYNYTYFKNLFGNTIEPDIEKIKIANTLEEKINVLVRKEQSCNRTGYINPTTNDCYGIGSGAGYIEVSNGTYTVDESMN